MTTTPALLRVAPAVRTLTEQLQAIVDIARTTEEAFANARASMEEFSRGITAAANAPTGIAGLEGRYYVLGGLDPAYASPEALDALVSHILNADEQAPGCWLLTPSNRATVAAAAIRGYARHRRGQAPSPAGIAWGRLIGDTRVLVAREAS